MLEPCVHFCTFLLLSFSLQFNFFFFLVALQPNAGYGLLIYGVSRSHTTTHPQSVGLLWTGDQLVAETST